MNNFLTDEDIMKFDSQQSNILTDDDIVKFDKLQTLTDKDIIKFDSQEKLLGDNKKPLFPEPNNPLGLDTATMPAELRFGEKRTAESKTFAPQFATGEVAPVKSNIPFDSIFFNSIKKDTAPLEPVKDLKTAKELASTRFGGSYVKDGKVGGFNSPAFADRFETSHYRTKVEELNKKTLEKKYGFKKDFVDSNYDELMFYLEGRVTRGLERKGDLEKLDATLLGALEAFGLSPNKEIINELKSKYPKFSGLGKNVANVLNLGALGELVFKGGVKQIGKNILKTGRTLAYFKGLDEFKKRAIYPAIERVKAGAKGEVYKYQPVESLSEVLPEGLSPSTALFIDGLEEIGTLLAGHKIGKFAENKTKTAIFKATKDIIKRERLPEKIKYSVEEFNKLPVDASDPKVLTQRKVASLATGGKGVSNKQFRQFRKQGIDVEIPSETIITVVDKPWYAKLKRGLRKVATQTEGFAKIYPGETPPEKSLNPKDYATKEEWVKAQRKKEINKLLKNIEDKFKQFLPKGINEKIVKQNAENFFKRLDDNKKLSQLLTPNNKANVKVFENLTGLKIGKDITLKQIKENKGSLLADLINVTKTQLEQEWEAAHKEEKPTTPSSEQSLIEEAKKYKTFEEWVESENPAKNRGKAINAIRILKTQNTKSYADIKGISENNFITVYRATVPGGKIEEGDFITPDKEVAKFYARDMIGQRGLSEVDIVKKRIRAKEAKLHPDHQALGIENEFIYSKKSKTNQLTDIWNKAHAEKRRGDFSPEEIMDYASKNKEQILSEYIKENKNVISNDTMKRKFIPAGYTGENSIPYQKAAGKLTLTLLNRAIQANKSTGRQALILTGGTGVGKSTAIQGQNLDDKAFVFDTNLTNPNLNEKLIQRMIDNGIPPQIAFIHRDPKQAFEGILERYSNPDSPDYKRIVKLDEHLLIHKRALSTFKKLIEKFGDKLDYSIMDNRGKYLDNKTISLEKLNEISYNYNKIKGELTNVITKNKELTTKDKKLFLAELLGTGKEELATFLKKEIASEIPTGEVAPLEQIPQSIQSKVESAQDSIDKFDLTDQSGFVITEPMEKIATTMQSLYDWTFTFGEARRTNPALYDTLMKSFARRNAGIEKAISKVDVIMKDQLMTPEDDVLLMEAYEDKRVAIPDRLIDIFEKFSHINNLVEQAIKNRGIFTGNFQERMIAENQAKIERIKNEVKYPHKSKRIKVLQKEIEDLKNMRYLPHQTVAQHALEAKINSIQNRDERSAYIEKASRISAKFKQRKGRGFLKDYLESGLLKPSDVGIRKLTMENLISYYRRSAMADIFDFAKKQGLVKPSSDLLKQEGWYNSRELGITSPELTDKLIHPLLADSLVEMKEMQQGKRGGAIRQMLGVVKVAQFIKPQIIFIYDAFQALMRGMYSINPIKEARFVAKSARAVWNKSSDYHDMNSKNLFQFPYETPRAARNEAINMAITQTQKDISGWRKKLESITNMSWDKGDVSALDVFTAPWRAMSNATWIGDKIQRMTSVYALEDMGYSRDEAVKIASRGHAAYSELSLKFKKTLSPIVFVHTFRVLMPMEMVKIITDPVIGVIDAHTKGQKIPNYKKKRWAKAIIGTLIIPIITDLYLRSRGFKSDRFGWKWKKTIRDAQGKEHEIIVGVNNIVNMPIKYWHRLTAYNPIDPSTRGVQGIKNFLKWEVHPVWRLFFWDIAKNKRSFGSGENVYDPNDHWVSQTGQIMKYSFGQMFQLYGKMMDAAEAGTITTKEMKENEQLMKQALSGFDRTLLNIFGYKYVRKDKKERQFIMQKVLKSEYYSRRWQIAKKYEGQNQTKRYAKLKRWYERCSFWIKNDMK